MVHQHKWLLATALRLLASEGEDSVVSVLWACSCGEFMLTKYKGPL